MSRHSAKGHAWRALRQAVLDASSVCAIGLPGCTRRATVVDHIIPISQAGEQYDRSNLRPACTYCSSLVGGRRETAHPNRTTRDW